MRIILAKNIGFCSGVRRAIDIVDKLLSSANETVYSLGPVIHNPQVVESLKKRNLKIISSLKDAPDSSRIVLPSHGSPEYVLAKAKEKNLKSTDVTCPYVYSVAKICQDLHKKGYQIIIIGDKNHPEIKALLSISKDTQVISSKKDLKTIKLSPRIGIISQTTQSKEFFFELTSELLKRNLSVKEVCIFNTICYDTAQRQDEAKELAKQVEALFVVGGKNSANTRRLFDIGSKVNKNAYLIEDFSDINEEWLKGKKTIGIISGASTPDWLVKEVYNKCQNKVQ